MKSLLVVALLALALGALVTGCAKSSAPADVPAPGGEDAGTDAPIDDATVNAVVTDDSDVELGELV